MKLATGFIVMRNDNMNKIIKFHDDMIGCRVCVLTKSNLNKEGFERNKIYAGEILNDVDWMVGCPVFKCDIGMLGLDYECDIIKV